MAGFLDAIASLRNPRAREKYLDEQEQAQQPKPMSPEDQESLARVTAISEGIQRQFGINQPQTPAEKVADAGLARPTVPTRAAPTQRPAPQRTPMAGELEMGPQRERQPAFAPLDNTGTENGPPEPARPPQQPSETQSRFNDAKARLDARLAEIDANPRGATPRERWARGLSIAGAWLSGGAESGTAAEERYGVDAKRKAAQDRFTQETDALMKAMDLEAAGIDLDVARETLSDRRLLRADAQDPNGIQAQIARKLIVDGLQKAGIPGVDASQLEGRPLMQLQPVLQQMIDLGVVGKGALEAELNALRIVSQIQDTTIKSQDAQIRLAEHEAKAGERETQERTKLESQYQMAETALRAIDQALPKISGLTTGVGAAIQEALPFSEVIKTMTGTNDLKALVDTVKGNIAVDKLLEVKAQGGSFGALSNTELGLLTSKLGSLDTIQNADQLRSTLVEIYGLMEKARGEAASGMQQRGMEVPQNGSAPRVVRSDADYNALPSGAEYIAPDGSRRRKR